MTRLALVVPKKWRTVTKSMIKAAAGTNFGVREATMVARNREAGETTARREGGGRTTNPRDVAAETSMKVTGIGGGIPHRTVTEGGSGARHHPRGCAGKDGELHKLCCGNCVGGPMVATLS